MIFAAIHQLEHRSSVILGRVTTHENRKEKARDSEHILEQVSNMDFWGK